VDGLMADFLLELRCEEIPARMQAGARADLEKLFRAELDAAGVSLGAITVWSTPRRLALIARDLPEQTQAVSEETKGPPVGAPDQALEGFLRKVGLTKDQLEVRDLKGKDTYFAVVERPGRAVSEVLAERLPLIVWEFPWPKSMRWGAKSHSMESLRWVRPLSGIVAILGDEVLEIDFSMAHVYADGRGRSEIRKGEAGLISGAATVGHRFHHPGKITIGSAQDYADKLRAYHVIVDHEERQNLIREGSANAARAAGLSIVADEGLVIENAGLTEWPVPLLGRFDEAFLDVPPEVIQLTARVNQKYFVCEESDGSGQGKLANAFVCTANIEASDHGEAIIAGNRKVLAARLSDARFFWEQDLKTTLAEQAKKLSRITFHEKLGTVADKVERVARLAEWLASEGIVPDCDPALARQAAELCKADLVTEMVGEFPELQGLMGGYYARAEGLPDAVADAIRDHYKPVGQGDDVPTAPVTVAVSLADKLDTLAAFWQIDERPTGSKDPFALRRAVIAVANLVIGNGLRLGLVPALDVACSKAQSDANDARFQEQKDKLMAVTEPGVQVSVEMAFGLSAATRFGNYDGYFSTIAQDLLDFCADRLKVQQREAGVRHDLIDAVFALGGEDDLVRLLARVHALQAFIGTEDGANLLAGYKRAANILKKEDHESAGDVKLLSYTPEPAEKALIDALATAGPEAAAAVEAEQFEAAMRALATLRAPIDAFFENVTVNDADDEKRRARLDLLARFRDAVHAVADFTKIEG
jgi:glycyl-tRNA synthetase beta chain